MTHQTCGSVSSDFLISRIESTPTTTVHLRHGGLWRLHTGRTPMTIRVTSGHVWVTEEGTLQDFVLRPGEELIARPGRLLVAEGLADSAFVAYPTGEQQ